MESKISLHSNKFKAYLATQFFGALNDNAFKFIIELLIVKTVVDATKASKIISLSGALFVLPFILFSSYAGYLADRYSKKTIMVWTKLIEIIVMYLGFIALSRQNLPFLLGVLFLMTTQSTIFNPPKYGILPELFEDKDLSKANGLLQMWTFVAIILGTALSGQVLKLCQDNTGRTGLFLIVIAIIGFLTSFFIPNVPATKSSRPFELNFLKDIKENFLELIKIQPLFLSTLGVVYFWTIGALFQMNILIYSKHFVHLKDIGTSYLLAVLALGMGLGGILAGRLSGEKVEFGLVPLGAIGMGIFSLILYFSYPHPILTGFTLFSLGLSSGFFIIPLNAYIQYKSPKESLGRILALGNFLTFSGILFAAILYYVATQYLSLKAPTIFLLLGLSSFIVIIYLMKKLPDFLLRFLLWMFTHSIYKIKIIGQENIPKEGGALLVCNHVSYVDFLLIGACIQRFIRFLIYRNYYEMKYLKPFGRLMKAIPIAVEDGPKEMLRSLKAATQFLNDGELVCIFPEGEISRTGNMLSFKRGLEIITKGSSTPIIPVYLDRVWGSIFSYHQGRFFKKIPVKIPYPVTVAFGKPLLSIVDSFTVRQAVLELGAEAFHYRKNDQELLSTRFYIQAQKTPFKPCIADGQGNELNYWRTIVAAMALSRVIARKYPLDEYLGILLPPSVGATLVNIAISITGKIPVNLNYTASKEALERAIAKCKIRHIITSSLFLEKVGIELNDRMVFAEDLKTMVKLNDKLISLLGFWCLPHRILRFFFRAELARDINSPATVIFTSGSTGEPKGVMLSHANINANIEGFYQVIHAQKKDTILGALPFFHSLGYTGTLWYPLTTGMSVVYHNNPMDAKRIGELCKKYKATLLLATPTFLLSYIRRCTKEEFSSLRLVVVGAEKLKERIRDAFYEKFQIIPLEGYGCTELSPLVSLNIPDFKQKDISQVGNKMGTIGHPIPGEVVKVINADTGEELYPGNEGLLLVKGANVMLGYLNDQEATDEVVKDGWYMTGDIAEMDEDGFVTIKDRLSRFSKIAGEMVSHLKIEEEIHRILEKKDEQVCVVTSVPDEKKGEALAVLYKGNIDINHLYEMLNSVDLPKLWIPKKTAFYRVDEIPILGSGKLDLKQVKKMAMGLIVTN
ncbi:MAG: acyl-[ACP]--phospholipid O-acyltransferase [bacterium]